MSYGESGELNIKQFGAQGNGITDDTAAINAAIADMVQTNGGVIYFPPGNYVISSSLVMTSANNITFRGSGLGCTQIVRASGFAGATFASLTGVVRVRDLTLPDFSVGGSNTAPGIPASTVNLTNPFPFDCNVNIIAGTITVITVGGVATGLTSNASGVTVRLQAGQVIQMTYSVVPTSWTWYGVAG